MKYKYSEEYGRYYSSMDKLLANLKVIRIQGWNSRFMSGITHTFESYHQAAVKNAKLGYVLSNADTLVRYLANIAIFAYSGYKILENSMSIGEFTMINSYSLMIISCMSGILQFGKKRCQVVVAYDRIQALYQEKEDCGLVCIDSVSEISAEHLCFSYGKNQVLDGVSFTLKRGNVYALVGENGSGKSTLINILCGVEQDYTGRISYNGYDMKTLDHYHLKKHILAITEQEPSLIFPILRDNITESNLSDEEIIHWFNEFKMDDFLLKIGGI